LTFQTNKEQKKERREKVILKIYHEKYNDFICSSIWPDSIGTLCSKKKKVTK
jgi:hypothetical protein